MSEKEVAGRLQELIQRFGTRVCDEPKRLTALLRDYCPNNRREVNLLLIAYNQQVPAELLSSSIPMQLLHGRLIARLREECGMTLEAATWAVQTWASALKVVGTSDARLISVAPVTPAQYGLEWIEIPAGEFTMGSTEDEVKSLLASNSSLEREWLAGELPQHKVYLDTYYISKTPVTVGQYKQFCTVTGHAMPQEPGGKMDSFDVPHFNLNWSKEDHPMVNVSWNDAVAYCQWLSKETGYKVTLLTEAEWEKAARGVDGRKYPWGNDFDSSRLQCSKQKWLDAGGTASMGSFPSDASPYGVLDMAGNVWDWCSDWYDANYYRSSPDRNPTGPASGQNRVLRGGSWVCGDADLFRCVSRGWDAPGSRRNSLGFRCVVRADTH
jgi:formylglycine-generating enzyme required for sulfatase activity